MSVKMGLGACQEDLEVQGEIDFDFFEKDEEEKDTGTRNTSTLNNNNVEKVIAPDENNCDDVPPSSVAIVPSVDNSLPSCKPKIVCFETVIPSPEDYFQETQNDGSDVKKVNFQPFRLNGSFEYSEDPLNSPLSSASSASSSVSDLSSTSSCSLTSENDSFEDSMTDVTPLSSKCHSPMVMAKGIERNPKVGGEKFFKDYNSAHLKDSRNNNNKLSQNFDKVNSLTKALRKLELDQDVISVKPKSPNVIPIPFAESNNNKQRKNPTFTNEEVRKIDQDNQRLLKKILAQQNRPRPTTIPIHARPSSSSINRQKQQRQIELDNMALLQRLEAVKPSKDINHSHLLKEYKRRPSTSSSRMSFRPISPASQSVSASCRNSAQKSGRNTNALTVPICDKAMKH